MQDNSNIIDSYSSRVDGSVSLAKAFLRLLSDLYHKHGAEYHGESSKKPNNRKWSE